MGRYFEKSTSHATLFYRCNTVENNHHLRGHRYNCDTEYDGSLVIQVCTQYCMGPMGTKYVFSDCKLLRLIGLYYMFFIQRSCSCSCFKNFSFDILLNFIFGYLITWLSFKKVYVWPAVPISIKMTFLVKISPEASSFLNSSDNTKSKKTFLGHLM